MLLLFTLACLTHADPVDAVPIPAGTFTQGGGRAPDEPQRSVTLSAFRIGRAEVTVAQFDAFTHAGGYSDPRWWSTEGWAWAQLNPGGAGVELRAAGRTADHPVVAVTWYEADAWCRWAGGRLPTEAEWERAACGGQPRRFPWGDSEEVEARWYAEGKFGHISTVHTTAQGDPALASSEGALNMAGNVWEWTADWYHAEGTRDDATDPTGPAQGSWKVLRGGSFMNLPSYCTCTHREPARPDRVAFTTGFRCAWP